MEPNDVWWETPAKSSSNIQPYISNSNCLECLHFFCTHLQIDNSCWYVDVKNKRYIAKSGQCYLKLFALGRPDVHPQWKIKTLTKYEESPAWREQSTWLLVNHYVIGTILARLGTTKRNKKKMKSFTPASLNKQIHFCGPPVFQL